MSLNRPVVVGRSAGCAGAARGTGQRGRGRRGPHIAPESAGTRAPAPRPEGGKPARGRIQQERRAARLPPGKQPPAGPARGEGRRRGAGGGAAGQPARTPGRPQGHRPPPAALARPRAPRPSQGGKFNFQRLPLSPRRGGSAPAVGPTPPPPRSPAHAPGPRPALPGPAAARQPAAAAPDAGRRVPAGRRAALEPRHRHSRGGGR